jgi:hypothetical protein
MQKYLPDNCCPYAIGKWIYGNGKKIPPPPPAGGGVGKYMISGLWFLGFAFRFQRLSETCNLQPETVPCFTFANCIGHCQFFYRSLQKIQIHGK